MKRCDDLTRLGKNLEPPLLDRRNLEPPLLTRRIWPITYMIIDVERDRLEPNPNECYLRN